MKKTFLFILILLSAFLLSKQVIKTEASPLSASYHAGSDTINVSVSSGETFNLTDIDNALGLPARLNEVSPGIWELNATLNIYPNVDADFEVTQEDCDELRIISYPTLQRKIIWDTNFCIANTTVYGWESGSVDLTPANRSMLDGSGAIFQFVDFWNSTLAYLGSGTKAMNHSLLETDSSIHSRYSLVYLRYLTMHNSSTIFLYGSNSKIIRDSNFSDCYTNFTITLQFVRYFYINRNIFDNASTLGIYDCYPTSNPPVVPQVSSYLSNNQFLNQHNENGSCLIFERSNGIQSHSDVIDNCKNNSLWLSWDSHYIYFRNLTMNNTGTNPYTGVLTREDVTHIFFIDCLFRSVNMLYLKYANYITVENVTFIGNYLGHWQTGVHVGENSHVFGCHIYNASWVGIQAHANSIIENNTIEETDNGILLYGGNIWTFIPTNNIIVRNNIIYNTSLNLDWWNVGIHISGAVNGSIQNILVENNTVTGGSTGILIHNDVSGVIVRNNSIALMSWGTGGCLLPYGYLREGGVSGYQNESRRRIATGIGIFRQMGGSWPWTDAQNERYRNITIENNEYNGTYLQSYITVDKYQNDLDGIVTINETSLIDFYLFEFTDSFYGGKLMYMNPANPIYGYEQANTYGASGNVTWIMALNYSSFNWQVPENSSSNLYLSWPYQSSWGSSFELRHFQPLDNSSRAFELRGGNRINERSCASWVEGLGFLSLTWNTSGVTGDNTTSWVYGSHPNRTLFNGVANASLWSWANWRTDIFYNYSSSMEIEIRWTALIQPWLPYLFILGMIGLGSMFGGTLYSVHLFKKREYQWALVQGVTFIAVGFGLFISWVFA